MKEGSKEILRKLLNERMDEIERQNNKPILVPNPELEDVETYNAGMELLAQANALLAVHSLSGPGCLNLHDHREDTAAEYINAVEILVATAIECFHKSNEG